MRLEEYVPPLTAKDGSSYEELGYTLEEWKRLYRMGLEHKNDRRFWGSIPFTENLRHLEFLRRFEYGKKALEPMEKVISIISISDWESEKRNEDEARRR